jgi:hypothetical protein
MPTTVRTVAISWRSARRSITPNGRTTKAAR